MHIHQTVSKHLFNHYQSYTFAVVGTAIGIALCIIGALGLSAVIPALTAHSALLIGIMSSTGFAVLMVWLAVLVKNCLCSGAVAEGLSDSGAVAEDLSDSDAVAEDLSNPHEAVLEIVPIKAIKQLKSLDQAYFYMSQTENNNDLDSYRVIRVQMSEGDEEEILIIGLSLGIQGTTPIWHQYEKKKEGWKCYLLVKNLLDGQLKYSSPSEESQNLITQATLSNDIAAITNIECSTNAGNQDTN